MIHFSVDNDSLKEIEMALTLPKEQSKMALRNAINNAAKNMMKRLPEEADKRYQIKSKRKIRKTLEMKKAKVRNLTAIITSKGEANALIGFHVTPRKYNPRNRPKRGHKANVLRGNSLTSLMLKPNAVKDKYRAFVVKFESGHVAIAQRVPGKYMEKPYVRKDGSESKREAIKELHSISTPVMLGYEQGVYNKVGEETQRILHEEIEKQISRYLGE